MSISSQTALPEVDLQPGKPPILHTKPADDAVRWAAENRAALPAMMAEHGSILIRGLGLRDAAETVAVFHQLARTGLMTEREAFASRQAYAEGVYSSSKWPPSQPMCLHHELSYRLEFPGLMLFACLSAPIEGGATGVADSTATLDALPGDLVERLEREGWMLVRNYNEEIGTSIAEAFGTEDRDAVESYCHANAIEFEWRSDGGLRTWQRRSAVVRHPVTATVRGQLRCPRPPREPSNPPRPAPRRSRPCPRRPAGAGQRAGILGCQAKVRERNRRNDQPIAGPRCEVRPTQPPRARPDRTDDHDLLRRSARADGARGQRPKRPRPQ